MLKKNRAKFLFKTAIGFALFAVFLFFVRGAVVAQQGPGDLGLSQTGETLVIATQTDIRVIIGRIIEVALGLVGVVMVGLIVYAGFLWMTSAGEPAKVGTAKKVITQAIIGLLIILSSLAITEFVIRSLLGAFFGGPGTGTQSQYIDVLSGALGNGIIADHYPARDATDIPRNAKIIITFKEAINPTGFIEDTNGNSQIDAGEERINLDNIKVRRTAMDSKSSGPFVAAAVSMSPDRRTFVIRPDALLGSSTDNINYTVALGTGIQKANGEPAFGTNFSQGYEWKFTTGTFVDETPPKIESVIPMSGGTYDRNVAIEITFDEAVDPLSVSGDTARGFNNLVVSRGESVIAGSFSVSNGYRTVNFLSNEACGQNSCGETIFCLPSNSRVSEGTGIKTLIKAATIAAPPSPAAAFPYPYDGVTDIAGNSLSGNGDSVADGPPADNYSWQFNTTGSINLSAPKILNITPKSEGADVQARGEISLEFDKVLLSATVNNSNLLLHAARPGKTEYDITATPWWTGAVSYLDADGNVTTSSAQIARSLARLPHGDLLKEVSYYPEAGAGVKDFYQNCFYPPWSTATPGTCKATIAEPYCCAETLCSKPCGIGPSGGPICP